MTLLSICQNVMPRLGLPRPTFIAASTDLTAQIVMSFANQAADELARYHDWQSLIIEKTHTTVATQIQTGAIPTDYDRFVYDPQIWNTTANYKYYKADQLRWRFLKQYGGNAGIGGFWRMLGNQLNILPIATAGQTIKFEYISENWAQSAALVAQSSFQVDTDTSLLPERLIELSIIWRFRQSRGFPGYAEDLSTFEREQEKAAAADRGATALDRWPNDDDPPPAPYWSSIVTP